MINRKLILLSIAMTLNLNTDASSYNNYIEKFQKNVFGDKAIESPAEFVVSLKSFFETALKQIKSTYEKISSNQVSVVPEAIVPAPELTPDYRTEIACFVAVAAVSIYLLHKYCKNQPETENKEDKTDKTERYIFASDAYYPDDIVETCN